MKYSTILAGTNLARNISKGWVRSYVPFWRYHIGGLRKREAMKTRSLGALSFLFGISLMAVLLLAPGCGDDDKSFVWDEWGGGEQEPQPEPEPAVELIYTEDFELAGYTEDTPFYAAFYRPVVPDGFHALGHYAERGHGAPCGWMFVARELEPGALAEPLDYELIGQLSSGCSFWKPIPPAGYVGLGFVAQMGLEKPDTDEIRCLREDLAAPGKVGKRIWPFGIIWAGSSVYQILPENEDGIYIGSFAYSVPNPSNVYFCIHGDFVQKQDFAREDVEEFVEQYGPLLFFHPWESYFLDEPEYVLDHGVSLSWGVVYNEDDYGSFHVEEQDAMPTSTATLLDDVRYVEENIKPYASDPSRFKYWLEIEDGLKPGDLASGEALIRVLPVNWLFTEIQFWFFYPFNGPGRAEVCAWSDCCTNYQMEEGGRHYGDWEHVSLFIDNMTQKLITVYMSRHDSGQWFRRCGGTWSSGLQFSGTHPIIYSAYYSHAHYPSAGKHIYDRAWSYPWKVGELGGTASVDLFDLTDAGESFQTFQPGTYRVISSALPGYAVTEPEWLEFCGRWGQYERLSDEIDLPLCGQTIPITVYTYEKIESGPTGPKMKTAWTDGDCYQIYLELDQ